MNIRIRTCALVSCLQCRNLEMLQPRASTPNFDCGWTETRVSIWRWELLSLPAESLFGTIPFPGGVSTRVPANLCSRPPCSCPHRKSLASESFQHWSSRLISPAESRYAEGIRTCVFQTQRQGASPMLPEYKMELHLTSRASYITKYVAINMRCMGTR